MTVTEPTLQTGRIVGIAGPVVDVESPPGHLPEINNELEFTVDTEKPRQLNAVTSRLSDPPQGVFGGEPGAAAPPVAPARGPAQPVHGAPATVPRGRLDPTTKLPRRRAPTTNGRPRPDASERTR